MNSVFGACNNNKFGLNKSLKDSKIKNKTPRFLIGAVLTAFVIIMSFSNLPASHAYSLVLTTPVGVTPNGIAFDPVSGNVYVANFGDNTVSVIDGTANTVTAIAVGTNPLGVAAGNGNIYVTNFGDNTVSVISGTSVIATIPVGTNPGGIAFDSTTGNVYAASYTDNTVSVISGTSVIATIPVGILPYGITAGNGNVYVANFASNSVSVISDTGNSVTNTIPVGAYPSAATFDSNTGNVYVANFASNNVSVINGTSNSVTDTIPVGANPYGITSGNGNVYVANFASNSVSVLSDTTNSVTDTMTGVTNPEGIAFDSANYNVYVVSSVLNSVSIFSTSSVPTGGSGGDPASGGGTPPTTGDIVPPLFSIPANIEVFPTSTLGAVVSYKVPTATDNSGITPQVTCDHQSGSQFSIGTTPVACIATDAAGNQATASFNVKVYTPIEASQKVVDQLNAISALKSGTITSLDAKLPYGITMIPGHNYDSKFKLNNFINEINSKCCYTGLLPTSSKPFNQNQQIMFTTEARDIVAATP